MKNKSNIQIITKNDLKNLESIIQLPTIILNDKKILSINYKFQEMLGYSLQELRKSNLIPSIIEEPKKTSIKNIIDSLKGNGDIIKQALKIRTKGNSIIWGNYECTLISYESETYILAHLINITHKKEMELHLSKILRVSSLMIEISHAIIDTDNIYSIYELILKNAIKSINHAKLGSIMIKQGNNLKIVSHVGFKSSSISNFEIPIKESFLYQKTNGKLDKIAKIDNTNDPDITLYRIATNDEDSKYIKSTITAPIYVNNSFFGVVNVDSTKANSFDLDDIKIMEFIKTNVEIAISNCLLYQEKVHLSRHDYLTGVYNKSYFYELLTETHNKSTACEQSFNLVIFDLNDLKYINDSFGHLAGDAVIKDFANECSNILGNRDILSRFGGDEFAGIFLHCTVEELTDRLNNFLSYLENKHTYFKGNCIKYSFSYGISTFNKDGQLINDLLNIADKRMYSFKNKYKKNSH
ncbi:diguanylate cyclase [Clostridium sp. KNHs214]|uniref:diguanylate cyclase n=1 Tax=Clostridium sp. KNHs214 TaxID=1540257 RepID=UPI0005501682|nr:diguanylate cyclase [Clostridium sp. KNHs214]